MEHTLNHGMCRCCASEGMFKNFTATYQWMGADEVYADMLKECFDVSLTTAEDYNNGGICEVCITQLRNASNFKKQVLQTEEQFKKALQDDIFKSSIVKEEVNKEDGDFDSDNNISEDFSGTEFEVPIKEENVEPKAKKRSAKASTSSAKRAKKEDGEPSNKRLHRKSVFKKEPRPTKSKTLKKDRKNELKKSSSITPGGSMLKHKTNAEQILLWSNATPIRCHAGRGYACCFCEDQFPDPADLKRHTTDAHNAVEQITSVLGKDSNGLCIKLDITALRCTICHENIDTVESLIDHLVSVHDKKLHTDIKNQILPFKFDSESLRCYICSNVFNKFKALLQHMSGHYRNFDCDQCDTGFVNRQKLRIHMKGHKTGEFTCTYCPKVFFTDLKKKIHESRIHINVKLMHKCHYCDEKFRDSRQKDAHVERVHGVTTFARKCQACNKMFVHQNALMIHMKRHHLIERHHKCTQCEKAFFSSTELREHMVKHTGKRDFRCEICLKSYGRKWTLREHMRIHADDRRFKCEHCNMAFVQKCSLKGHLRSKHGETE